MFTHRYCSTAKKGEPNASLDAVLSLPLRGNPKTALQFFLKAHHHLAPSAHRSLSA